MPCQRGRTPSSPHHCTGEWFISECRRMQTVILQALGGDSSEKIVNNHGTAPLSVEEVQSAEVPTIATQGHQS
ncbi:hypothetical protein KC19_8G058800 [Ceratodon purpureus]|uniref:Uncharacterized protein n=1 Tax=Ceratodon purpureus TaxID=3225 RepID=A0A8T0H0A3_CERPU|nr:hypothetical protein KC19_8G058800 [Ceratodon purpureus]